MKEKLSFESKIIILDRVIGNAIDLFLNTFLSAYFYKITEDNMIYIANYYIIVWIAATIGALILGNYIKRKNKVLLYRCGTCIKAGYILLIIILKEKILEYIWLVAIIYGITVSTTGFPFNMLESQVVDEKERVKYMGYKSAIGEMAKIFIPIFLGAYITIFSYQIVAILVFILSIIKVVITLFIKNVSNSNEKIKIRRFLQEVKDKPKYPIKKLYMIEFLKGITFNGALEIIISLLIVYEVKTDLNLGIWSSFFSICMIISMFIFGKKYNKKKPRVILLICNFSIIISFILMTCSINITTIIIYNIVYYTFMKMLYAITEINLFDYSNKEPFEKELNTEYFIFREISLNIGRVFGYVILLYIGLSHNLEYLKLLFLCTAIAMLIIARMSKYINLSDK